MGGGGGWKAERVAWEGGKVGVNEGRWREGREGERKRGKDESNKGRIYGVRERLTER